MVTMKQPNDDQRLRQNLPSHQRRTMDAFFEIKATTDSHSRADLAIHLFSLPGYELQDYDLSGAGVRAFASDLAGRLCSAAVLIDKLQADGWLLTVFKSNLEARHPEVRTHDEAVRRLR